MIVATTHILCFDVEGLKNVWGFSRLNTKVKEKVEERKMEKMQTIEQYKEVIKQGKHIMMFSADWCPDCRVIEPVLPEIEANHSEYTFHYVDRDDFIDLCAELSIFGIPSFVGYSNGEETGRFVSKDRKTKEEIEEFINGLNA